MNRKGKQNKYIIIEIKKKKAIPISYNLINIVVLIYHLNNNLNYSPMYINTCTPKDNKKM